MDDQEFKLRQQIAGFVEGAIPLQAFHDWFYAQEWEASPPEDWSFIGLIVGVDRRLAVFTSGFYAPSQLQQSLTAHVAAVDGREHALPDPMEASAPMVHTTAIIKPRPTRQGA